MREDNHFTEDHALAAIEAYYDPIIHKLTRERIERRTAIELPKNKRNGRSQAKHLEGARAIRDINNDNWREGNGRKPKADLVRKYAAEHPDANHSEIARALGISRPTVIKWLRGWKCDTDGLPDGTWYENGHVHVDMTEPKAD